MGEKRSTPLLEAHKGLGARLTEFAGWDMPLQYGGVVAEHHAVRNAAGLFDVSHLGKLRVKGPEAGAALQVALTADVEALETGHASYSLVLTADGGCIDDVFVYRMGDDEWLVVPNAANVTAVAAAIEELGAETQDEWARWAILALQGPDSFDVFAHMWPDHEALHIKLHQWTTLDFDGAQGFVARTGYTGERGFELYVPAAAAARVFEGLIASGAQPVGLGARDTLRLEMGYALYGHELTRSINPLEAGLGWTLSWNTPFRGRDALEQIKTSGPRRKLFGLRCTERGVPRQGYTVSSATSVVGEITSGNFSPTLNAGIALALGPAESIPSAGDQVWVDARGRRIEGDIVKPPFVVRGK